ncbi:MAG: Ig-like domain-containing protein, partial [Campylobacterota bacterium]|nr:Ig-like domain-containing protein [Campylobacterota bacterium]
MAIARISDIRGLVTSGESSEEILRNRDVISEHGGILTIHEFAKIIFDDGREIEITGPTSFTLDSSFFEADRFDVDTTQINDIDNLDYVNANFIEEPQEVEPRDTAIIQNESAATVQSEQLDTQREYQDVVIDTQERNLPEDRVNTLFEDGNEATEEIETQENEDTTDNTTPADTTDVNDAPTLTVESSKTVDEDGSTSITFSAADSDGTIVETTATAEHGTVTVNDDGTISYAPDADYNGADTITVTTKDDDGTTTTATSSITVNDVNDAPTLTVESSKTVDEDGSTSITFSAADSDGTIVETTATA